MRGRKPAAALGIDEVRTRFESWRQTRKGKACIPDNLWSAAVEVARRDGVNRTAVALRLDGGKLKRRVMAAGPGAGPNAAAGVCGVAGPTRDPAVINTHPYQGPDRAPRVHPQHLTSARRQLRIRPVRRRQTRLLCGRTAPFPVRMACQDGLIRSLAIVW